VGLLIAISLQAPFRQDPGYHNFADRRTFLGIPNFGDVVSNLGFLIAGPIALYVCLTKNLGSLRTAWFVTFAGITLLAFGSGYYHWEPNDPTLVWDRITLTLGFMGMFVAIVGEYIGKSLRWLLVPALLIGIYSVLHWKWFDDLRLYYAIQVIPLAIIPLVMAFFAPRYTHRWLIMAGVGWYILAKIAELQDKMIFAATGEVTSGHTLKHIFAAIGCSSILLALYLRRPTVPS
jgi:hypothetical protein